MNQHDFDHQRAETFYTVADLLKHNDDLAEGQAITLDLQFAPSEGADMEAAIRALGMFGYEAEATEDGDLEVQVPDLPFRADDIWLHEERTTKIALERGFRPDGWGFWGN